MTSRGKEEKRDFRLEVADRLIQQMELGTARWQRPWKPGEIQSPVNAVTGKPYRGVNYENLMTFSPDPSDPRWCTYKQAQEKGWQVRQGASGLPLEVWKEYEHKRTEEEIRQMKDLGAMDVGPSETRRFARYYTVFHASQIDGIPPLERPEPAHVLEGKPDERLPKLAATMGVDLQYGGSQAFYRSAEDRVQMPPVESFELAVGHDTTLLHELSHATGHAKRLNRDVGNTFGGEQYAIEELRAEMSAAMTAASLGLGFDPAAQDREAGRDLGNSAAYLASWLKALPEKDRKQTIVQVIKDAQGISDYLMERTPEIMQETEVEKAAEQALHNHAPEPDAQAKALDLSRMDPKDRARMAYNRFHQELPENVGRLIEQIDQRFDSLDPTSSSAFTSAMRDTRAASDEVFGIGTIGEDRGLFLPEVELEKSGMDSTQKGELRDIWHNTFEAQTARYQAAIASARERVTKRRKERGREVLKESGSLSTKQVVMASYWKHGVPVDDTEEMVNRLIRAVEEKDLKTLLSWIGNNSHNPGSEEAFSRITGVSLGKTQKERVAHLETWAGADRVAALNQEGAEKALQKAEATPRDVLRQAFDELSSIRVQGGLDGQEYIERKVADGFTHIGAHKKGAVVERFLHNPQDGATSRLNDQRFRDFCKAVVVLEPGGDLVKAMETAKIPLNLPEKSLEKAQEAQVPPVQSELPDSAGAFDRLAKSLEVLEQHSITLARTDGTHKTVNARRYLDEGVARGFTQTDTTANPLAWVNPETSARLMVRDDALAATLRAAHAVDSHVGRAIQSVARQKTDPEWEM